MLPFPSLPFFFVCFGFFYDVGLFTRVCREAVGRQLVCELVGLKGGGGGLFMAITEAVVGDDDDGNCHLHR